MNTEDEKIEGIERNNQPEPSKPTNPLLEKVRLPGETFQLPSKGIFYNNDELKSSVKDGEVHVYPMTAMDELIVRSSDHLFSGKGIESVIIRCVPEVNKPLELLARDVDFLMACIRKVSYGPSIEIKQKHTCDNAKTHNYTINLFSIIQKTKCIDPTTIEQKFAVDLPNGQHLKFKPSTFQTVVDILQDSVLMDNAKDEDAHTVAKKILRETISDSIKSVDDITDQEMIAEWVESLHTQWVKDIIRPVVDSINDFGATFSTQAICEDCGEEMTIDIGLNPTTFFS